ncbi:ABC transporter permease [Terriglobus albidus]|uniref:ABC transporter permease n=1 Tax=Terriglobus albidus TaxID=1592106 RepID=UPI0021DFC5D6|nr:ABC transporter permease [Terriglobus albidus]
MSLWSRIAYAFRSDRLNREIDEEFAAHMEEAIAAGEDPAEVRRSFGSLLRLREQSREARIAGRLYNLRADLVFGWRQLLKRKITTATAILSLALAIGACTSAFRLIDALFLRPLHVAHADQLNVLVRQGPDDHGVPRSFDDFAYPNFARMRAAAKGQAELIAASFTYRTDLTYATDNEMEKGYVQYVSGTMFPTFALRPTLGRLFTAEDDITPGAHPIAVISYNYWSRRFANDPQVVGRTVRIGGNMFQIIGVGPKSFTGTEPGILTDIFLPAMMDPDVARTDISWVRVLAVIAPGVPHEPLRAKLDAVSLNYETERARGFVGMSRHNIEMSLQKKMVIEPAAAGVSRLQGDYREALVWLGVLVALVLLIACANVANLMTAQAASRAREMALRVSIGAGRSRLMQLVLVQNAMLAFFSAVLGAIFAWWAAPFVVSRINPPDNPAHLILPADWRVLAFGSLLTLAVTLLFGLAPALRASAIQPVIALKGGEEPRTKDRSMYALIAAQVAFCFVVLFFAGLFLVTYRNLSKQRLGFDAQNLLLIETTTPHGQSPEAWSQMADTLRTVPGVKDVAISSWPLLSGGWTGSISVNAAPPTDTWGYFLSISPGWLNTMRIQLIDGRDFNSADTFPGEAIVNQSFVKIFFNGVNPIGRTFEKVNPLGSRQLCRVVGVVSDATYGNLHEPLRPVAYVPFHKINEDGTLNPADGGAFVVRTSGINPISLAATSRRLVAKTNPAYRVNNVRTQQELVDNQSIRERLLALLALFFAIVALLLAAIGLYGVLSYSVLQREREIGIRIAVGARIGSIVRLVTAPIFVTVLIGAAAGIACGITSVRYVQALLFGLEGAAPSMLIVPTLVLFAAALLAAIPAVLRAARIDPSIMLRAD